MKKEKALHHCHKNFHGDNAGNFFYNYAEIDNILVIKHQSS